MSEEDCESVCVLLQSGYSFQDTLVLLKDKRNENCFKYIEDKMNDGFAIESFIHEVFTSKIQSYLQPFCMFLPFSKSLVMSMRCIKEEKNYRMNTLKELTYPIILFIGTWIGCLVFTFVCFPTLISLFKSFSMDTSQIVLIQTSFVIVTGVLSLLSILLAVFLILWFNKKSKVKIYSLLCTFTKNNFFKSYQSNLFARFYLQCAKCGSKTKEILQLLQSIESHLILKEICSLVEKDLMLGKETERAFSNNYLDRTLVQYMRLAIHSSSMDAMLEGYIKINEEKMKKSIKLFAKSCQVISYGCIGFIIIIVYQILILPLTLMAKL